MVMFKKRKKESFLIYFAAVSIICFILTLAFGAYLATEDQVAKQFNKQQLILSKEAAAGIENYTGVIEKNLFNLSKHLASYPDDITTIHDITWQNLKDKLIYLFHMNAKGVLIDYYPRSLGLDIGGSYDHMDCYLELAKPDAVLSAPFISNVQMGETGRDTIYIAQAIHKDNKLMGVMCAAVDLKKMLEIFLASIKSGKSGYAWLLDNNGNLLYHPRHREMIGNNIFVEGEGCENCHENFNLERVIIARGESGSIITSIPNSTDQRLMAFSPIKIGPRFWLVAVEVHYHEVTALLKKSFKDTLFLSAIAIFTICFVALYVIEINRKRVAVEEEAKDLRELLEAIFENAPLEIAVIDDHQKLVYVNKFWKWMHGMLHQDVVGHRICEPMTGPDQEDSFRSMVVETLLGNKPKDSIEINYLAKSGPYKDKRVYKIFWTVPFSNEQKKVVRCALIGYNVTEVKLLERQLIQSEKLAASGKLAASVAHEINNPIYGIQGCLDYLRNNLELSEKDRKFVELSYRETERISRLVRQMHDFYHPSEEQMQPVDINELLSDILVLEQLSLKEKNIKLVTFYQRDLPKVMANSDQLKQVFLNLISNAKDAVGREGKLTISTYQDNKYVAVSFADTGVGISDENKERVFEAFYTTKREVKGVGLGLSVSYGIIKYHQGEIKVADVLPHGAEFIVRLPALLSNDLKKKANFCATA